jgi:hypothetical protein
MEQANLGQEFEKFFTDLVKAKNSEAFEALKVVADIAPLAFSCVLKNQESNLVKFGLNGDIEIGYEVSGSSAALCYFYKTNRIRVVADSASSEPVQASTISVLKEAIAQNTHNPNISHLVHPSIWVAPGVFNDETAIKEMETVRDKLSEHYFKSIELTKEEFMARMQSMHKMFHTITRNMDEKGSDILTRCMMTNVEGDEDMVSPLLLKEFIDYLHDRIAAASAPKEVVLGEQTVITNG